MEQSKNPNFSLLIDWFASLILMRIQPQLEDFLKKYEKQIPEEEIMTRNEVMEYLKITRSTLHVWTKQGKFPSYGVGSRVYFKRSEILEAMTELKK